MSLTLLLFRHAKSDFDAPSDHERTLTEFGVQQAMFMGELLKEKSIQPDLVICSSAVRAKTSMELAMAAGEWECDTNITEALYNTTVESTLDLIRRFSAHDSVVMLVGHEPTWSELALSLCSESLSFNAAGMCCIELKAEHWKDVEAGGGELLWYEHP